MYRKGGSFPDLTGDGKITQADILKGRGVFKEGGMKDPNSGITALRKVAPNVVKTMGYKMGGRMMYQRGGIKYMNGGLPKYGMRNKFQTGGSIYDDNTVQAAGQGGVGTTASTVFQENNPELQEQRLQALDAAKEQSMEQSNATANQVEQIQTEGEAQADFDAQQAQNTYLAKEESIANTAKMGYDVANQAGAFDGIKATRAANTLAKTTAKDVASVSSSTGAAKDAAIAVQSSNAAKAAAGAGKLWRTTDASTGIVRGGFGVGATAGANAGKMAGFGGAGLTGVGTLGKFATSGAGLGIGANLLGAGISKWSDDNDPTKSNFGEYSGAVLSGAGTGASFGSFLGPAGTIIGGVAGGIYGGIKQFFGTKKAKKAKEDAEKKFKKKQTKLIKKGNKELVKNYGSQMSRANAGRIAQKTYSGYDLGQNVIARKGGYRNMPQYI